MVLAPATAMKNPIEGSWYPSGFHGHFRGKSRGDFINEYRYLAKPEPPSTFLSRSRERPSSHVFSEHDNREAFLKPELFAPKRGPITGERENLFDATSFNKGLGRRKIQSGNQKSDPRLIHWMPDNEMLKKAGPLKTEYIKNYSNTGVQIFVKRPKTTFDEDYNQFSSMNRYVYGYDNPNKAVIDAMAVKIIKESSGGRTTGIKQKIPCTDTVGACMRWSNSTAGHLRFSRGDLQELQAAATGLERSKTMPNIDRLSVNESAPPPPQAQAPPQPQAAAIAPPALEPLLQRPKTGSISFTSRM